MHSYKLKDKYKKHQLYKQRKSLKKRNRRVKIIKSENRQVQRIKKREIKQRKNYLSHTKVKAPKQFSILKNSEETILFINRVENLFDKCIPTFIILKEVDYIDHSAITVLLSVMHKFKVRKIKFFGDFPDNSVVRKKLETSDFFEILQGVTKNFTEDIKKENKIFATSDNVIRPEKVGKIINQISQTVWSSKRKSHGLYRVLIELMDNTNNHASVSSQWKENWWLSINHDKGKNTVDFYFVDYGQGILGSLSSKIIGKKLFGTLGRLQNMMGTNNEPEIIKLMLEGKHKKKNSLYFRGKGIPSIYKSLVHNEIDNLHIITNNVYADVKDNIFRYQNNSFSGTFFHWQINKNNKNKAWEIK